MIEALLLPFQLPFMQNAFLIGAIIAVPTALLSCYLVLKGWALMGDAVSHAILPGVVAAFHWRDLGEAQETPKQLQFWIKPL